MRFCPTASCRSLDGWNIPPAIYGILWILLSASVIIFNKWIFTAAGFPFPLFLTMWHMIFATICTRLLSLCTDMLSGLKQSAGMSWREWAWNILPIGVLFSFSLSFSNLAYMHLSISFLQMLKAMSPAVVMIFSAVVMKDYPTRSKVLNIVVIVGGVILTAVGEIHLTAIGLILQLCGILAESLRIVLVQKLMTSNGLSLDPLCSLYYFAPVCAIFISIAFLVVESSTLSFDYLRLLGPWVLISNGVLAFALNIALVTFIGKTSSLALTLTGFIKDITLISCSAIFFGSHISNLQIIGYSIALCGLVVYRLGGNGQFPSLDSVRSMLQTPKSPIYAITIFGFLTFCGFLAFYFGLSRDATGVDSEAITPFVFDDIPEAGNDSSADYIDPPPPLLLFMSGTNATRDNVNDTISRIGTDRAAVILFSNDGSQWNDYDWFQRVTFISNQTRNKYRAMQQYLKPEFMASYRYVLPWDGNIRLRLDFDLDSYMEIVEKYKIHISHPSVDPMIDSSTSEPNVMHRLPHSIIGHWTQSMDMKAPVLHVNAWNSCFYPLLFPSMKTSDGINTFLYRMCADTSFCRMAVIDDYGIIDMSPKSEADSEQVDLMRNMIGKTCMRRPSTKGICLNWREDPNKKKNHVKVIHSDEAGESDCIDFDSRFIDLAAALLRNN